MRLFFASVVLFVTRRLRPHALERARRKIMTSSRSRLINLTRLSWGGCTLLVLWLATAITAPAVRGDAGPDRAAAARDDSELVATSVAHNLSTASWG